MNSSEPKLPVIYLKAAEIYFSKEPVSVLTVLGSCLAVTMFHQHLGTGAICHGLLPQCAKRRLCSEPCVDEARYVECSIEQMVKRFIRIGALLQEIEVKIFGGADMFAARPDSGPVAVGKQNIATAMRIIKEKGLRIVSLDVGGVQGRKIFFNTRSGKVLLKRLQPSIVLADSGVVE
jgi:chemotaxis protein CheD